ncbi:tRNA pseudouridine(38-40) synthase TruA [soil metagenome]
MPRYFLQLSFHGRKFHGWQIQDNAHTVQAELNSALKALLGVETETTGCGRTDTGVHAGKFYVHFDAVEIPDESDFIYHLNCLLPFEVAIQKIIRLGDDAHARFDATSRTYRYFIHHVKNPFLNDTSYFFPFIVDLVLMNEAALILLDHTDFSCFSKSRTQVKTNICKIISAEWKMLENQLVFEITADRFLRNMVRAIVGTLLEVGEKNISLSEFTEIIENKKRAGAGASVPGHGLFLVEVSYPYIK